MGMAFHLSPRSVVALIITTAANVSPVRSMILRTPFVERKPGG
jgi:hypothetical protein